MTKVRFHASLSSVGTQDLIIIKCKKRDACASGGDQLSSVNLEVEDSSLRSK